MTRPDRNAIRHRKRAALRFDRWADSYGDDRISNWFRHYQQLALSRFRFSGDERFLDAGCGPGWAVRQAARSLPTGRADGVDISPVMVEKAKRLSADCRNCCFQVGDVESLPFGDGCFDAVLCTFSFHHYRDPLAALVEFHRVLKDRGTLVLVDSARDLSAVIWLQDRWRRYLEPSHVRYHTVDELTELIHHAGFSLQGRILRETGFRNHGKLFTGLALLECRPDITPEGAGP